MKARLLVFLVVVAALLGPAQAARAEEPVRIPSHFIPFFTFGCGYFLGITDVEQDRVRTVFSDGRQITTGKLVLRATHLDGDGSKSIVFDASGPLFFTPNADGSFTLTGTGSTIWVIENVVYLVRGQATFAVEPNGTSTFSHTGNIENLCETLA